MQTDEKIEKLREVMRREHLSAYIFTSTDPHNGEYIPAHWESRKWISGFNGSAGVAVVTLHEAALWTDSRYFIAAEEQLSGSEFVLMRERVGETPSVAEWLGMKLAVEPSPEVGIDGTTNSYSVVMALKEELRKQGGITLRTNFDPLAAIWPDRPCLPLNLVEIHPLEYAGEKCSHKFARIRQSLKSLHAEGTLVSTLDDVAWTLNLRGADVHCNPVFVSYLLITIDRAVLFIDRRKVPDQVVSYLQGEGVEVDDYENVGKELASYPCYSILLDPSQLNYNLYRSVQCGEIVNAPCPITAMKAVKNDAEIDGFRRAMLRDGVAMVKFLRWLNPAVKAGGETEMSVDRKLTSLRASQPLFRGVSFDTIAGYQDHGAIVHYEATSETDAMLKPQGLLLIDSGAQYQDGTTDITRTIALGPVTEEQRKVYTLVLKGHIQLEMLKFPNGASGTQLDAVARMDMWREGMNFLHGTGHGVGSYLNVHEGPHQIRMEWKPTPLLSGMTVTDEPGLYLAGKFGVRIENTLLIKDYKETTFGKFLQFEPLTLCPIDLQPVVKEMLTKDEIEWLDAYHLYVRDKLLPLLDDEFDRQWLLSATAPFVGQVSRFEDN